MITREDVMSNSAVGAVVATFLVGISYDVKQLGLTWALAIIAAGCVGALLLAYLGNYTENSGD